MCARRDDLHATPAPPGASASPTIVPARDGGHHFAGDACRGEQFVVHSFRLDVCTSAWWSRPLYSFVQRTAERK